MHSFWCCYGTAIESFAKLADSIYFHSDAKVWPSLGRPHWGGSPVILTIAPES